MGSYFHIILPFSKDKYRFVVIYLLNIYSYTFAFKMTAMYIKSGYN